MELRTESKPFRRNSWYQGPTGGGAGKRKLSVLDEQREGQCGLSSVSKGKSSHNEDREIGRAQIM